MFYGNIFKNKELIVIIWILIVMYFEIENVCILRISRKVVWNNKVIYVRV